jgi:hypothetical protein
MLATKSFAAAMRALSSGMTGAAKNRRIDVGEQSAGEHSMPDALADLARQIVHVGVKARVEQNRGIDVALLGVSGRMIEQIGKAFQEVIENLDGCLMH